MQRGWEGRGGARFEIILGGKVMVVNVGAVLKGVNSVPNDVHNVHERSTEVQIQNID